MHEEDVRARRLDALLAQVRRDAAQLTLLREEPMCRHTTFRIGGPAQVFAQPAGAREAAVLARACAAHAVPLLVVGNGSNLLVHDAGIRGVVLHVGGAMAEAHVQGTQLVSQAGLSLAAAARLAARHGLAGLAFAEGIPGTLGGGAAMNAGAYGGEMAQVVACVTLTDRQGAVRTLSAKEMQYGYRHSAVLAHEWIVTDVTLALAPGDAGQIEQEMRRIAQERRAKQPLQWPSAGSAFKRPAQGYAAQLIDQAGLKGLCVGGAQVSPLHAGFIVNTGAATAADVLALMETVRERVLAHSGVALEPEIRVVGGA